MTMGRRDALPWPKAVTSFGYFPPEAILQIPMSVFENMALRSREENLPPWHNQALESGEEFVLMLAKTFYSMIGDVDEPPGYMVRYVELGRAKRLEEIRRRRKEFGEKKKREREASRQESIFAEDLMELQCGFCKMSYSACLCNRTVGGGHA